MHEIDLITFYEDLSLVEWPALETQSLGPWQLRFSAGYTKRANSVSVHHDRSRGSSLGLLEMVQEAEQAYFNHGLPCIFKLSKAAPAELDGHLARCGYELVQPSWVMTLDQLSCGASVPVSWYEGLDPLWLDCFGAWDRLGNAELASFKALTALTRAQVFHGLLKDQQGVPVAIGTGVIDGRHLGILNLRTRADCRRRGHGRRLMEALLAEGRLRGAREAYLQVVAENQPATGLYRSLGFQTRYLYHYRVLNQARAAGNP